MKEILNNLLDYIENRLYEEITLDELAKESHYSKTHLSKLFNYVIGLSIPEYITKRRLSNAALSLYKTNKKIEYIAHTHGFQSSKYFSTLFKKELGISPSQYRKSEGYIYLFPRRIIRGGSNKVMTKLKEAVYEVNIETMDMNEFEIIVEKNGSDLSGDVVLSASIDQVNKDQAAIKIEVE